MFVKLLYMKNYFYALIALVVMCCCQSPASQRTAAPDDIVLTVTIEPQRFFLEKIAGEGFHVNVLLPEDASHETYEPAPSTMVDMSKSPLYFYVGGLGFENAWLARLAQNNPDITTVNCSQGIEMMEGHHHHHHEGDHDHDQCCSADGLDPHVWTSPETAITLAKNMCDALVAHYPERADTFRKNFAHVEQLIHHTDSVVASTLNDAPKAFIIYHPAYGYFAKTYGLHQHSIEFEGKNPSPAQIKSIVDLAKAEKINTVFIQKGYDEKNAQVIAQEIGADVFTVNPMAYDWSDELIRIANLLAR